jgi:hypothetical protein
MVDGDCASVSQSTSTHQFHTSSSASSAIMRTVLRRPSRSSSTEKKIQLLLQINDNHDDAHYLRLHSQWILVSTATVVNFDVDQALLCGGSGTGTQGTKLIKSVVRVCISWVLSLFLSRIQNFVAPALKYPYPTWLTLCCFLKLK